MTATALSSTGTYRVRVTHHRSGTCNIDIHDAITGRSLASRQAVPANQEQAATAELLAEVEAVAAQLAPLGPTRGQQFTSTLRQIMRIGPRTKRHRTHPLGATYGKQDVIKETLEAVDNAIYDPGYYSDAKTLALSFGWGAVSSWYKHVDGYRIDASQRAHLASLSPWEFTALLGEMVDAGVTNVGQGEEWFRDRCASHVAERAAQIAEKSRSAA